MLPGDMRARRAAERGRGGALVAAWVLGGVAVASLAALPSRARGQDTYEAQRTQAVLAREGLTEAEGAEGRRIGFVRLVRDDVFIEDDGGVMGWMTWANVFHWLTRQSVIERELLFDEGDAYSQEVAEESMRNLRDLGIFSYVRIVPVETESADEVGMIVYTRDLWSLRLEQGFQITGSTVDNLLLQLTERNLLGFQKRGSLRFFLVPDVFRVGQVYFDHRLGGGTVSLLESFDLIFGRSDGSLEGFAAGAIVRSPFYDLSQRWGFDVRASFVTEVERRIQNARVVPYDIPETPEVEAIASVWRERALESSARLLYRQGERYKQTFGLGLAYDEIVAEPNAETGLAPGQEAPFARDVLPTERRQIGPLLTYDLFTPTFATYEDLASYGVSENVRGGPSVQLQVGVPIRAFGSSSDSVVFEGRYGYVLTVGELLGEVSVAAHGRLEDGRVVDQLLRTELRGATPKLGPLRLVWRFTWEGRRNDTSRELVTIGGDNGLRGYVSQAFLTTGGSLVRGNLELRTLPFVLWSVHVGAALFYDVGTVYDAVDDLRLHHTVGVGLRILFPQFNRLPFRVDAGIPVDSDFAVVPSVGATQAVPVTAFEDESAL